MQYENVSTFAVTGGLVLPQTKSLPQAVALAQYHGFTHIILFSIQPSISAVGWQQEHTSDSEKVREGRRN